MSTVTEDHLRHSDDVIRDMLQQQIASVAQATSETRDELHSHVAECAALQKRVLVMTGCILTWLIAHSPEAGKALGLILKAVAP